MTLLRHLIFSALLLTSIGAQGGVRLGDLTWQEAATQLPNKTVVVPFAAGAKQHGPHLPMSTDADVLAALTDTVLTHTDVIVAPAILHGWFPAFRDYPGTEIADPAIFSGYVRAICESLIKHGAQRLVILNLGIGNATGLPLKTVARDLVTDHQVKVLVLSWEDLEDAQAAQYYQQTRGGHADEGETSIMLHLHPEKVRSQQLTRDYRQPPTNLPGYQPGYFDPHTEAGLFGDATLATAAKGEAILNIMAANLIKALQGFNSQGRKAEQ